MSIPRRFLLLCACWVLLAFTPAADRPAYRLFTATGKAADYDKMLAELTQADVVFFGEQHNDALGHWLELQMLKDLAKLKKPGQLVLGLEMFERDVQPLVAQYAAGTLPDTAFERQARPWPNYATDYKPLLQFAREQKLSIVGTNAPRLYARQVARGGLAALQQLPPTEKALLAPLPLKVDTEWPGYKKMAAMFGADASTHGSGATPIIQAQALKDATMAHFIRQSLTPGQTLLHVNGSYHSDNHDGIVGYLRQNAPALRVRTISVVSQENLTQLANDNQKLADFVIVIPEDMSKTY
jgi:uncharacterized iron-regulated protein